MPRRPAARRPTTRRPTTRRPPRARTISRGVALALALVLAGGAAAPAAPARALEPTAAGGGPGVVGPAWDGLTDQAVPCGTSRPCVEPASPSVAVSATHVVQAVSQATRITDRAGGAATTHANRTFFDVASWSPAAVVADPRVVFDPAAGRWLASLFAGTCAGGAVFLAVSETADPTGPWRRFHVAFPGRWPSSPVLGHSTTLVAVGVNERAVACSPGGSPVLGAYLGTSLHVVDRATLATADPGALPADAVFSTAPDPAAFALTPAVGLTAGDPLHAVVALDDGSTDRADLGYLVVAGTVAGGLSVTSAVDLTTAAGLGKLADPPTPVDAGGLIGIQRNALDLRPTGATWRDGRLLVTSTTRCTVGTATRPCGRVTELAIPADPGAPTVRQDLLLGPTAGYTDTFVPGATYADDGTIWTAYSQAGAGRYVSVFARRQLPGDAPGAWSPGAALVAAGRGPYGGTAGAGLNERWGDHLAVARDPAVPASAWQAGQVADTGGGWATRVTRLGDDTTPPAAGAPQPGFATRVPAATTGVRVDLRWTAADAGSGIAGTTVERSVAAGPWTAVATLGPDARTYRTSVTYGRRHAFRVLVVDGAGNTTVSPAGPSFTPTLVDQGSALVSYAGTWSLATSSSFLGGRSRHTGVAGRRATLTFTGLAVAWVTSFGPTRGRAGVYVDGALQGEYGTGGATIRHRQVLAARSFAAAGRHTYRVVVRGTAGHPRVDVDAFVILR